MLLEERGVKIVIEALQENIKDIEACSCASFILRASLMNAGDIGGLQTFLKDVSGFGVLVNVLKECISNETVCGNIVSILFFVTNNFILLERDYISSMINENNVVEQVIKAIEMHEDVREIVSDCIYFLRIVIREKISKTQE